MTKILLFLATDGAFTFEECNCHIIASKYVHAFGGTGSVTLQNDVLELNFWLDRDRLFMDVRAINDKSQYSWISFDILKEVLTGEVASIAEMNEENTAFVKANFPKIQELFRMENRRNTEARCRELKKQRAKRLFG